MSAARAWALARSRGPISDVHGLPHDRVGELEALGGGQDPKRGEEVGGLGRLGLAQLRQAGGLRRRRTVAEHRHGLHDRPGSSRPSLETQQDRLRDGGGADAPHALRAAGVRREAAIARLAEERLEEEGVAARGLAARGGEGRCDVRAEPALAQGHGRLGAERARADDAGLGRGGQAGDRARVPLAGPGGGDDGDGDPVEAGGQVVEETQRLGVGPVEVVDEQRDRALVRDVVEKPVEPVEHGEGAVGRRPRAVVRRREERLRQRRSASEEPLAVRGPGPRHDRLEQLAHAPVGEVALELARPRAQAPEAAFGSGLGYCPQKARLAESGGRLDEDDVAPSVLGRLKRVAEVRELELTLEKGLGSLDRHVMSWPPGPPSDTTGARGVQHLAGGWLSRVAAVASPRPARACGGAA